MWNKIEESTITLIKFEEVVLLRDEDGKQYLGYLYSECKNKLGTTYTFKNEEHVETNPTMFLKIPE